MPATTRRSGRRTHHDLDGDTDHRHRARESSAERPTRRPATQRACRLATPPTSRPPSAQLTIVSSPEQEVRPPRTRSRPLNGQLKRTDRSGGGSPTANLTSTAERPPHTDRPLDGKFTSREQTSRPPNGQLKRTDPRPRTGSSPIANLQVVRSTVSSPHLDPRMSSSPTAKPRRVVRWTTSSLYLAPRMASSRTAKPRESSAGRPTRASRPLSGKFTCDEPASLPLNGQLDQMTSRWPAQCGQLANRPLRGQLDFLGAGRARSSAGTSRVDSWVGGCIADARLRWGTGVNRSL
jgi:hypothetical protein